MSCLIPTCLKFFQLLIHIIYDHHHHHPIIYGKQLINYHSAQEC